MSTITFDFRHYYRKGERRESDQIAYQWDLGHVAEIYVPVNATYEIHYCFADFTETDDYGVESITAAEDGGYKLTAHIPNELFERSGELKVYVIGADDNHVLTTYEGYITIRGRAKPEDYVDDDPENEATRILTEAREARDAAVEAAEQAEAAASQSAAQASIAEVYDATATYAIGDYCLHDGQLYECTAEITTPEAWTAAHWTATTVGTELNDIKGDVTGLKEELSDDVDQLKNALITKAEQDGAYPDLTAGQMLSKNKETDSVPYNFRAVGHEATLEYTDAIVGGTIVNNQFCNDPTFTDENKWYPSSTMTVTISNNVAECVASDVNATLNNNGIRSAGTLNGHVVGVLCDLKADEAYNVDIAFGDNHLFTDLQTKEINTSWATYGMLAKHAEVRMESVYAGIRDSHNSGWKKIYVKNYRVFDLTQMFGTAIADFLYSLGREVGVAWLKKHFPKLFEYQPYNAGEIVSVQGLSQHVTVGFNQWDEEWEVGGYSSSTGLPIAYTDRIRSKNPIKCLPETTYCIRSGIPDSIIVNAYDANGTMIDNIVASSVTSEGKTFTTPVGVYYLKFSTGTTYGATYIHDICINLSDPTRNGEYEPYQKRTYSLDSTKTFRGIFKLDASNNLYADGDRYLPDGTVQRRYGVVDLGTLSWEYADSKYFRAPLNIGTPQPLNGSSNFICSAYSYATAQYIFSGQADKAMTINTTYLWGNNKGVCVRDTSYTDAVTFKSAMSGVYLVYELATPTTEEADPYITPQIVDPDGTEEYVSTSIVPVGHESRYPDDLRAKLDGLPWNLSMIAPIENGDKASQPYAVGKYFLHNNQFCKAKTAIAANATFTLNTNYEVTTVADEIYSALH